MIPLVIQQDKSEQYNPAFANGEVTFISRLIEEEEDILR